MATRRPHNNKRRTTGRVAPDGPRLFYDPVTNEPVDMRPPASRVATQDQRYEECLAAGDYQQAVRCLVARLSLVRMAFGSDSLVFAEAQQTLAEAYWRLLGRPEPARMHAELALGALAALHANDGDGDGNSQDKLSKDRANDSQATSATDGTPTDNVITVDTAALPASLQQFMTDAPSLPVAGQEQFREGSQEADRVTDTLSGKSARELRVKAKSHLVLGTCLTDPDTAAYDDAERHLLEASALLDKLKVVVESGKDITVVSNDELVELDVDLAHTLGRLCMLRGASDTATEFLQKAVELAEAHPQIQPDTSLQLLRDLATTQAAQPGQMAETCIRARDLTTQTFGLSSVEHADSNVALARAYLAGSDDMNARACLLEARKVYVEQLGAQDPDTVAVEDELVRIMVRAGKHQAAVKRLQRLIKTKREIFGPRSFEVADSHQLCGSVYLAQGEENLGLKQMLRAYDILKALKGVNAAPVVRLQEVIDGLVGEEEFRGTGRHLSTR